MKAKNEKEHANQVSLLPTSGFSQLSKEEKIRLIASQFFKDPQKATSLIKGYWHINPQEQKIFDEFSENTLTNFYLPFGVAPNFLIDGKIYCIPMVIEESSVVAAASKAAKFWLNRGGFHTQIVSTTKNGQVHFLWEGREEKRLKHFFQLIKPILLKEIEPLCANMKKRGGGVKDIELVNKTAEEKGYYQLFLTVETCDAMGANFINSILEKLAATLAIQAAESGYLEAEEKKIKIIMSILSNYTPDCLVRSWVECPVEELHKIDGETSAEEFIEKFSTAIKISKIDPYRATTHNKGIFNGIDAVILATGNDFRAVEACGHAYAARSGRYQGLSDVSVKNGLFRFTLELPIAVGTVGGITSLHPLSKASLELLGNPSSKELMKIVASMGLAQNFAAVRSLTTTGIQKGHMKMHLLNILNHFEATEDERMKAKEYFAHEVVSFTAVRNFLYSLRKIH